MSTIAKCPFCHLKDRVLKQNQSAQVFLSNPRKVPGHFLVTPLRHVEEPWSLTGQELTDIFELISQVQKKLSARGLGVDVRQNHRPYMKQGRIKVDHLHFHVYPRSLDDDLYEQVEKFETAMFIDLPEAERIEYSQLLN